MSGVSHTVACGTRTVALAVAAVLCITAIPFFIVTVDPKEVRSHEPVEGYESILKPPPRPPRPSSPRQVIEFDAYADRTRQHADLVRWGRPDSNYKRSESGAFLIGKPDRTRCARWVLEYLDQKSIDGKANRSDDEWRIDPVVPEEFRATLTDYRSSGWQRGHLAASGNHVSSERAQAATFWLTNAAPQTEQLNNGLWRKLEDHIRHRVKTGEVCWVLTIPVWKHDELSNLHVRTIGDGVWVPTHFAKAVLWAPDRRRSFDVQTLAMQCWLMPNDEKFPDEATLADYLVSGDSLEADAGLDVFNGLPDDIENKLEHSNDNRPTK